MSTRMSFHLFVESKDLEVLRGVITALEFDPESSEIAVAVGPELPGCWLTLNDASRGVLFWGALGKAVPEGMVRWWEVSNCEYEDSAWVRAYAPNGKQRWDEKFERGLARLQKELGLGEGLVPDDWGEFEGETTSVSLTTADWEEDLASLLGGKKKKKAKKPAKDPHEAWFERDDAAIVKKPKELVAAAPEELEDLRDQLDFAEALWRSGRAAEAKKMLAKVKPSGEHQVRQTLDAAAPTVWVTKRARYLPDFSLALLDALPKKLQKDRYWLHRAQALARLNHKELLPLLRKLFASGLVWDLEMKEALKAMPKGAHQKAALKLFAEAGEG